MASCGDLNVTCRLCWNDPKYRADWGCDGPAAAPFMEIDCTSCNGMGDPDCSVCSGTGREDIRDCPNRCARQLGDPFLTAYRAWPDLPPVPGGLNQQANIFVEASQYLKVKIDEVLDAKERKK